MKERPILFSAPMVKAILAGQKTQTRRLMKPQPEPGRYGANHPTKPSGIIGPLEGCLGGGDYHIWRGSRHTACLTESAVYVAERQCPYGEQGDRLWVRETWGLSRGNGHRVLYKADVGTDRWPPTVELTSEGRWSPSIYMPRRHSRITLQVTSVRVDRLQRIRADDVVTEGIDVPPCDFTVPDTPDRLMQERDDFAREEFGKLWDSINGKRAPWSANPWVWVVGFRRLP